jgi:hypothetical protein
MHLPRPQTFNPLIIQGGVKANNQTVFHDREPEFLNNRRGKA